MKHLFFILITFYNITLLNSQDFNASDVLVFPGMYNSHEELHIDQSGNKYIAGVGTGEIDFDFGAASNTLPSSSNRDLYLAKYDTENNLEWLLPFDGSTESNQIRAIATDDEDNVYISGTLVGMLNLTNDGQNEITNFGSSSMFVAKFDKDGSLIWKFTVGDSNFSQFPDKMYISNSRLIIQFVYNGTFDVDPGTGISMLSGNSNALLVYDLDGSFIEANSHSGKTIVYASAIDAEGNFYLAGSFSGLVSFDYKTNASFISIGLFDAFIAKYDINFNLIWLKRMSKNSKSLRITNIALDTNNDIVACGYFAKETNVGTFVAENDANYIMNLSKNGDFESFLEILNLDVTIYDISINSKDQIILSASFDELVDVDPTVNIYELTPSDNANNIMLVVYNSDFGFVGADQIYAPSISTFSLQIDKLDKIHILTDFMGEGKIAFGSSEMFTSSDEESFIYYTLETEGCSASSENLAVGACKEAVINEIVYTSSGDYIQTLMNTDGCDSILTISVTIYPDAQSEVSHVSCGPYSVNGDILTTSGVYTILMTTVQGCDSIVLLSLEVIEVDKGVATNDNELVSTEVEGDSYQWYDCDTELPIENATNRIFAPEKDGSYQVEISKNDCISLSECIEFVLSSTKESYFEITISPNPTQGLIYIKADNGVLNYEMSLLDLCGREVTNPVKLSAGGIIDLGKMTSGIYILKLENSKQIALKKIVVN